MFITHHGSGKVSCEMFASSHSRFLWRNWKLNLSNIKVGTRKTCLKIEKFGRSARRYFYVTYFILELYIRTHSTTHRNCTWAQSYPSSVGRISKIKLYARHSHLLCRSNSLFNIVCPLWQYMNRWAKSPGSSTLPQLQIIFGRIAILTFTRQGNARLPRTRKRYSPNAFICHFWSGQ